MMNKKAVNEDFIKAGILAVVMLVILLTIFSGLLHFVPFVTEKTKCETYVNLASNFKNPVTKQTRIDMNKACPTREVDLRAKGKGEDIDNNALDDILNEMYLCGKRWGFMDGEVKKNPFSQWKLDNVCVVCSDIIFDDRLKGMKELKGLLVRSTESEIGKSGKTYYEFFTGDLPSGEVKQKFTSLRIEWEDGSEGQYKIDTEKKYYIVYAVNMKTTPEGFFTKLGIGTGLGLATGAGIGVTTQGTLLPLNLILSLAGAKIRAAKWLVIGFTSAGALGGAYVGGQVRDKAEGALLLVPGELEETTKYCKTLGRDPFEDPWKEEAKKGEIQ